MAASGVNTQLVTIAAAGRLVPDARRTSVFGRYVRSTALFGLCGVTFGCATPALLALGGAVALGPLGLLLGSALGIGLGYSICNRSGMLGNLELRERLAEQLRVNDAESIFVGLCREENNTIRGKILRVRAETDDNVGFLRFSDDELQILTEEGVLRFARDEVANVELVPFVEAPFLQWVGLRLRDAADCERTVLLVSRETASLSGARPATKELYRRVVDWFAAPAMADLD